ncbi:hypothetical protein GN244_ATG13712 [Phytophthora infestans]|uniref:Uncharacterized protein n=1 Tax=Phytophthora infestans TaxID=4787 RepID=A0A833VYN6_PHYIN|nr:hypothetical protein GN244_ATG13712 [Phytophthora infestans]
MEDTLLSEAVPRMKPKTSPLTSLNSAVKEQAALWTKSKAFVMDAHSLAREKLTEEMQQHFCASSDFPEFSAAEEEAMLHKE